MVYNKNKKAGMELSLNLIIMLIIGMVVLGLVIGFVNSMVSDSTASFKDKVGDDDKLKLEALMNCGDALCVDPSPSITVQRGKDKKIYLKIRNTEESASGNYYDSCTPGNLIGKTGCNLGIDFMDNAGAISNPEVSLTGPGFIGVEVGGEVSKLYYLNVNEDRGTY